MNCAADDTHRSDNQQRSYLLFPFGKLEFPFDMLLIDLSS